MAKKWIGYKKQSKPCSYKSEKMLVIQFSAKHQVKAFLAPVKLNNMFAFGRSYNCPTAANKFSYTIELESQCKGS